MTMPEGERERIRRWLIEQAAAHDPEALLARVGEALAELRAAAEAIPPQRFDERPPGDAWSPRDCLAHLVEWHMRAGAMVLHVALTGELPPDRVPDLPAGRDELIGELERAQESLAEHVRAADPAGYVDVRWEHPFFGPLNWREWLLFLRIHARDHSRQLTAMREALGA